MDPLTALGAAAAGAQFVGIAVKTILGTATLIEGIRAEPKRAVQLLTWIQDEAASIQRLLSPNSPVFSQLSTNQYIQIAPCALNTRKALDKVNTVLVPLARDIEKIKSERDFGSRMVFLWKSVLMMKATNDIEKYIGTIRLLNATLLRELHVCGFETQSLLRYVHKVNIVPEYSIVCTTYVYTAPVASKVHKSYPFWLSYPDVTKHYGSPYNKSNSYKPKPSRRQTQQYPLSQKF